MKNKHKLILANVFALLAVVSILTVSSSLGFDIKNNSGLVAKLLLVVVPQLGFIYLYFRYSVKEKVMA